MIFNHHRIASDANSTRGILYGENVAAQICAILEDAFHEEKVFGKTRIPAGMYQLGFHQSPRFDNHYSKLVRNADMDYLGMIEVQKVPNFVGVLFHGGNTPADTEGCLLCGDSVVLGPQGYYIPGGQSVPAFLRAYRVLSASLRATETWLQVVDFDR